MSATRAIFMAKCDGSEGREKVPTAFCNRRKPNSPKPDVYAPTTYGKHTRDLPGRWFLESAPGAADHPTR